MGSIERRLEALESIYGTPPDFDEESRRRGAQEILEKLKRRLDGIAERIMEEEQAGEEHAGNRRHALENLEESMHHRGTIHRLFREGFGYELGDEEYQKREALRQKYGAVSLAPPSEQEKLRQL